MPYQGRKLVCNEKRVNILIFELNIAETEFDGRVPGDSKEMVIQLY